MGENNNTDKTKKHRTPRGDGGIYFNNSRQQWVAEIRWTDSGGQKQRKSFVGDKRTIVKEKLEKFKRELLLYGPSSSEADSVLFSEYISAWLKRVKKPAVEPSTYSNMWNHVRVHICPVLGDIPIGKINTSDVQTLVDRMDEAGKSFSTINHVFILIRGCFKDYLSKIDSFRRNPCDRVILPTKKRRDIADVKYYTKEEREKIIKQATSHYPNGTPVYRLGYLVVFLMYTGMRFGEATALTWDDIDFENDTITISKNVGRVDRLAETLESEPERDAPRYTLETKNRTKTKSGRRVIPMSKPAKAALIEIQKVTGRQKYVIMTSSGRQMSNSTFNKSFRTILEKAGIEIKAGEKHGAHTLRHTFASMLFENGCDVKTVSELLGHADTAVTQNIYIHITQERKAQAIKTLDNFVD